MALRKLLSRRFFDSVKTTMSFERIVVSSPPLQQAMAPPNTPLDDGGFLRRFFLLRHVVYHSGTARLPEFLSLPVGEKLRETLKGINNAVGVGECRVGLGPVPAQIPSNDAVFGNGMSVKDARKILRASQMEKVKAKLKNIPESSIPYSEFLRICVEACENSDQGAEFAKILDESGNVIVLGKVVFLRPEQVTTSIESLIYQSIASPNDPRRKELKLMEKKKLMIDEKARAQVQAELYLGLSFLTVQTIGFMRLTFWELSWDVMEPICFFVTTFGFGLSYLFFLKTSTEPTFQGFFHQRFRTKQERLMKINNFDMCRYNELCKACYPNGYDGGVKFEPSLSHSFHHSRKTHDLINDLRA